MQRSSRLYAVLVSHSLSRVVSTFQIAKIAFICEQVKQKNTDFTVLTGSSSFLLDALRVGAVGCISAISNILGPELIKLLELYKQSQSEVDSPKSPSSGKYLEEAYILQNKIVAPDLAVSSAPIWPLATTF